MGKSVAVLGLGKYGRSLADNLYKMGADTLVADIKPELVREYSDKATTAIVADLRNENELTEMGIKNMDVVVVCIGSSLEPSIMSVNVAKDQGVPLVMAKASTERMGNLLLRSGADKIIYPEDEMGIRTARKIISPSFLDYFDLDENLCIIELKISEKWIGRSLKELDFRRKYHANVVSFKEHGSSWSFIDPDKALSKGSSLLIMIEKKNLKALNYSLLQK